MLQTLEAVQRRVGLKGNQFDRRIEPPQPAAGADKRAARPEARDKMRQPTARLLDDLRPGRVVVRAPVRVVVVLVRIEIPLRLCRMQPTGFADRAVRSFERIGQHQLGAEGTQYELAFTAGVVRHAQRDVIAAGRTDCRVGDAGVAGRGVENRPFARQRAGRFAFEDHSRRGAVLHRPARILPLRFRIQLDPWRVALEPAQAYERRTANEIDDGGARGPVEDRAV